MDYFHTISALHHKLLDYFTNVIGISLKRVKEYINVHRFHKFTQKNMC